MINMSTREEQEWIYKVGNRQREAGSSQETSETSTLLVHEPRVRTAGASLVESSKKTKGGKKRVNPRGRAEVRR